ncbi:transmembrane protein 201-like [Lytechinus variegatus]|uniref:transmembrane protein 201-like n=1 Tax=Lytechinus variegatus TaxID=7654 RepID=UPI001BB187FB|nr:transmembrane protein 201-like [Lytechinus variegatus]
MFVWKIFKKKKSVEVKCWFCQASTTVPAGNVNCFDCPECEQYNGFTKDGGYNKPIPAQYSEELNQTYSRPGLYQEDPEPRPSPLCDVCQTNQELKIKQLAAFVPSHEKNFDEEAKEYSDYLEEAYRLCPACNENICGELYRQDARIRSKLLGQRLHQATLPDAQVAKGQSHSSQKFVYIFRVLAIIAATLVLACQLSLNVQSSGQFQDTSCIKTAFHHFISLESRRTTLSLLGLVCGVLSSLLAGKYRLRYLDCVCPLLWMLYMGSITALPSSSSLLSLFPWLPSDAIPIMLAACLLLSSSKHALQGRRGIVNKVFRNKRLRNQAVSALSDSEDEDQPIAMPRPPQAAPPASTPSSLSLSQSIQSENGEIQRILLDQDISGLSLGPPGLAKAKNKDVWTAHTPPTSRPATPLSSEGRPSSREFRPIISPATFNPPGMTRSASQNSFVSSFSGTFADSGPFQDQRVTSSRENLVDRGRSLFEDNSSDGSSPICMIAKESPIPPKREQKTAVHGWTSCLLPGILGFSLGINCAAALYFLYGR